MLAVSLGLLLVGSGVSVRLEELGEMQLGEATTFGERLVAAIAARTARRTVLDDPHAPECREADRCVRAVRARTETEDVVFVRLYAGPTKIRLIAERLSLDGLRDGHLEENVPRDDPRREQILSRVADRLFPEPARPNETQVVGSAPTEAGVGVMDVLPWVVLGAGVAALAAGVAFKISTGAAKSDLRADEVTPSEFDAAYDRFQHDGQLASGLLIGGAAGIVVGGVLLMFTD